MLLKYYNAKLDRYDNISISSYRNIEKTIMDYAIKLYGNDFYLLMEHDELEYTLNRDISCIVDPFSS